jgi:hypothetical protein
MTNQKETCNRRLDDLAARLERVRRRKLARTGERPADKAQPQRHRAQCRARRG